MCKSGYFYSSYTPRCRAVPKNYSGRPPSPPLTPPPTIGLESFAALLDQKLVRMQNAMTNLEERMSTLTVSMNQTMQKVEDNLVPIQNKMSSIEKGLQNSDLRIAKLESMFENKNNEWQLPQDVHELIQQMQKEIDYLRASPKDGKETETIENHKKNCSIWGVI